MTREELFRLVWSEPMRTLAPKFGLSDSGLAKICRRHKIPIPQRGYWAKLRTGKHVFEPCLRPLEHSEEIPLRMIAPEQVAKRTAHKEANKHRTASISCSVAKNLSGCERLVSRFNAEFKSAGFDGCGLLLTRDLPLSIRVGKGSLRRAMLLVNAILKALKQEGCATGPGPIVTKENASISFKIYELTTLVLVPTDEPFDEPTDPRFWRFKPDPFKRTFVPKGTLIIEASGFWQEGQPNSWRDTKKSQLESRLPVIVSGLLAGLEIAKNRQIEEDRRQAKQADTARKRAELLAKIEVEKRRVARLHEHATKWRESQQLRDFIAAVRTQRPATYRPKGDLEEWISWATQQADRLDPLVPSPPSVLDERPK